MHDYGLANDKAIGNELADGLAGVGVGDFVDFVRVQPYLALAAADDRGREALLRAKVDPVVRNILLATASMRSSSLRAVKGR